MSALFLLQAPEERRQFPELSLFFQEEEEDWYSSWVSWIIMLSMSWCKQRHTHTKVNPRSKAAKALKTNNSNAKLVTESRNQFGTHIVSANALPSIKHKYSKRKSVLVSVADKLRIRLSFAHV